MELGAHQSTVAGVCPANSYLNEPSYHTDHYQDPYATTSAPTSAFHQTSGGYELSRSSANRSLDYRSQQHQAELKLRDHSATAGHFYGLKEPSAARFQDNRTAPQTTELVSHTWPPHEAYYDHRGLPNDCFASQTSFETHSRSVATAAVAAAHQQSNGYFCAQQISPGPNRDHPHLADGSLVASQYSTGHYFCPTTYTQPNPTSQSSGHLYPVTSGQEARATLARTQLVPDTNTIQSAAHNPTVVYYQSTADGDYQHVEQVRESGDSISLTISSGDNDADGYSTRIGSNYDACYRANNGIEQRQSGALAYNGSVARTSDNFSRAEGGHSWCNQVVSNSDSDESCARPAERDAREKLTAWSNSVEIGGEFELITTRSTETRSPPADKNGKFSVSACNRSDAPQPKVVQINPARRNQCNICGRNYARPSTLKTHLRTHTNERPFKCNVCSKTFSQAANLTAHQRVHTGE